MTESLLPWITTLAAAGVLGWSIARERPEGSLAETHAPSGARLDAPAVSGEPGAGSAASAAQAADDPDPSAPPPEGAEIDFARLEFPTYDPPSLREDKTPLPASAFPPPAGSLHQRRIALVGFPLVTGAEGSMVEELLLTRFPPGCCFGAVPVFDEWVLVRLDEPLRASELPRRARVEGLFEVGEELDELGSALSLYRMTAEALNDI